MSSLTLPVLDPFVPESLAEAIGYLGRYGKDVAILVCGRDPLVSLKAGLRPRYILSLAEIPDLNYPLFSPSEGPRIGAMTTVKQVIGSQPIKGALFCLVAMCSSKWDAVDKKHCKWRLAKCVS